jgi:Trehalase
MSKQSAIASENASRQAAVPQDPSRSVADRYSSEYSLRVPAGIRLTGKLRRWQLRISKGAYVLALVIAGGSLCAAASADGGKRIECDEPASEQGIFYEKKAYVPTPLPRYEDVKGRLPSPIYDDKPEWVETYWKAWQLAFRNFHEPEPHSGFVSQFIDASFSRNVYLWDSSFMTMFCNTASPLVPCISTLDNFYARQQFDGEICREIERETGRCWYPWINRECKPLSSRFGWSGRKFTEQAHELAAPLKSGAIPSLSPMFALVGTADNPFLGWLELQAYEGHGEGDQQWENLPDSIVVTYTGRVTPHPNPIFTLEALDNAVLAWAELDSYRVTGDKERLERVWEPLVHYYAALQTFLQQGNGLYITDFTSMDNSPRNHYLEGGGTAVDTSSQQVLFARNLAQIAAVLGKKDQTVRYTREADALAETINRRLWDARRGFYFDLTLNDAYVPVKTVAAYWTLLARVASPMQAQRLVNELKNPRTFGRPNAVPTLAADEPLYDPNGGYWRGAVWAPTNTMVIRGLEAYGYHDFARQLARQHLDLVADVYKRTGTIWENYSPEKPKPGNVAKEDFVGWSGIGPILYLIEYGIGLQADAARNELVWDLRPAGRQGCERFRFNGHVTSLIAEPAPTDAAKFRITVKSDGNFVLKVVRGGTSKAMRIKPGIQRFMVG